MLYLSSRLMMMMDIAARARNGTDTTLIITGMHFNCQVFYLLSLWLENVIENGILRDVLDRGKWTNDAGGGRKLGESARIDQNERRKTRLAFSCLRREVALDTIER